MIKIFDYIKKGGKKEYETGVRKGNSNSNIAIIKVEKMKIENEGMKKYVRKI